MQACTELAATRASAHASLRSRFLPQSDDSWSDIALTAIAGRVDSAHSVNDRSGVRLIWAASVRAYWAVFIATRFERPACERCDLIERPRGELPQLRLAGPFRSRLVGSGRVGLSLVWSGRVGGDALSCVLVDVQCDSVTQSADSDSDSVGQSMMMLTMIALARLDWLDR